MTDVPYLTYLALYVLSFHVLQSNSRTSTLWKLNSEEGKIVEENHIPSTLPKPVVDVDPVFNIITSTIHYGKSWVKRSEEGCKEKCQGPQSDNYKSDLNGTSNHRSKNGSSTSSQTTNRDVLDDEVLDCGKAVNFTFYDNLVGVNNRHNHPHAPEPQVALIFKKKSAKNATLDVDALERKLKKAKREKPKSVQLYNQIGNFWRIKGDAQKSIECFRRALAVSPHNAEVLLNLARVLLNLQYLDDAIFLTRRSLEVQPPDKNAWQQHFTLGEIFRAYGHYQEASLHLRHSLELKPEFQPALEALKNMEIVPEPAVHIYTLLIILCLGIAVIMVLLSHLEDHLDILNMNMNMNVNMNVNFPDDKKAQRHFNRAMAIRSLKMGISPRSLRSKR